MAFHIRVLKVALKFVSSFDVVTNNTFQKYYLSHAIKLMGF